jgi:hypothetical protein
MRSTMRKTPSVAAVGIHPAPRWQTKVNEALSVVKVGYRWSIALLRRVLVTSCHRDV